MSKMFSNLTDDDLEDSGDVLGGGGPLESGAYDGVIKLAYVGKSQRSNSQSVTVHIDCGGRELRETIWFLSGQGDNFYYDKVDKTKKRPLPGYTAVNDLCLLATGFGLADQDIEEKTVSLWDFDAKKEIPQQVPVLIDLIGKPITVGVLKEVVDKNTKVGNEYVPSGETREQNTVDKFFHSESKRTVTEVKEEIEEAVFYPKWVEKNTGKTRNKVKGAPGKTGAPGRPTPSGQAGAPAAPKKNIFGNK